MLESGTLTFAVELYVVDIVDIDVLLHAPGLLDLVESTVDGVEVAEIVERGALIVDVLVCCLLAAMGVDEVEEDDDEEVFMKCK